MSKRVSPKTVGVKPIQTKPTPKKPLIEIELKWVALLLTAITFLVYAMVWGNGLVWDDDPYITLNDAVKSFDLKALLTEFHVGNFHPLTMLTLAVEYALVGESPWLYHFNNLLLHSANSLLLYLMILRLSGKFWVAILTAVLFAIHPLHVESVAWAAERKDVLYVFFLLLAMLQYMTYVGSRKWLSYGLSLLFFVLACLSKGMAVVLPALLLITDWWMLDRKLSLQNLVDKIPYLIVTFAFAYIATTAQKEAGADASTLISSIYTAAERFQIVAYSFLFYWVKTFWPIQLLPFYPYPPKPNGALPSVYLLASFLLIVFAVMVYVWGRRDKRIWWGVGFFIISISTVLQIFPVGSAIVADRYYYLSSVGPLFLIAAGISWLMEKYANVGNLLAVFVLLACAVLTFNQVSHWKNGLTLFAPAEQVYPEDAMVLSNLGWHYIHVADFAKGKSYLQRADNNGFKNADVCRTIASMYIDEGDFEKAKVYVDKAYGFLPTSERTDWLNALALQGLGKSVEAEKFALKALEANPTNKDFKSTYATVLVANGKTELAKKIFDELGTAMPDDEALALNKAFLLRKEGDLAGEIAILKDLIAKSPEYLPAYKNIGVTFAELGQNENAIAYWSKAAELDNSGDFEYNIGLNYATRNLIEQAVPWYIKAAKKGKKEAIDILTQNGVAY